MAIDNVMLTVNRLPEIVLSTGTDLVALAGIALTALVVVSGAIFTSYQFSRTIKSQEKMASNNADRLRAQSRSENLAKNRQDWINNLRVEVANFLSVTHEIYNLSGDIKDPKIRGVTDIEVMNSWEKHNIKADKFYSFLAKARFHESNIKLLLNPKEEDSMELAESMDELIKSAFSNANIYRGSMRVIDVSRKILKFEWERVKDMI